MKKLNTRLQTQGIKVFLEKIGYSTNVYDSELQGILDATLSNPTLTQREIEILTQRYGFRDNNGGTYKEVGARLGCSRNNVRLLEVNAIRKILHPEIASELGKTRFRLRKLIPTLEYDVLYDPSDLSRKINVSSRYVKRVINELCEEFDLAQIKPYLKSDRCFVMRIGEQSQDLPIPSEPFEVSKTDDPFHDTIMRYEAEYRTFWKEISTTLLSSGFVSSSLANKHIYGVNIRQRAFKDFMSDSMLPVAIHQDYRLGTREPLVIYHPKILREVRVKQQ